jgi:hypothetical protein
MAYSYWSDSYWYTDARNTHGDYIDSAQLFISPKKGEQVSFTYKQLCAIDPDTDWVARTFPDAPDRMLMELLLFIDAFKKDMERSIFKFHGWKTLAQWEAATQVA